MKNSDRPLPLVVRVFVGVVSAALLFPLVLAVVALMHGAAIPVARWSAPLAAVLAGAITVRAKQPLATMMLVVWAALVVYYAVTFFG